MRDCGVLRGRILPDSALGFDDPTHIALGRFLHDNPVGIVEPDRTARFEVIHPEVRATLLLCRPVRGVRSDGYEAVMRMLTSELLTRTPGGLEGPHCGLGPVSSES